MKRTLPTVLLLFLAGCSLTREYPDRSHFVLEAQRRAEPGEPFPFRFRLPPLEVGHACTAKEITYRISDVEYRTDYYSRFLVPPGEAISDLLEHWLSDSGFIVNMRDRVMFKHHHDFELQGSLEAFHVDLRDPDRPRAVLIMRFRLLERSGMPPQILLSERRDTSVDIPTPRPSDAVRGWNTGLISTFEWLEDILPSRMAEVIDPPLAL